MTEKTLAEKAKELENLVKSEQETEKKEKTVVDLLKSALSSLTGKKDDKDIKKSEGEEKPSEESPSEDAPAEEGKPKEDKPAEEPEVDAEKAVSDKEINDLNKVEDVEAGTVSADEFLGKSMDFMNRVAKAVVVQSKEIEKLNKRLDAISTKDEGIEKSLGALLTSNIELLKVEKAQETAPTSKMAGKEQYLAKSEDVEEVPEKKTLSDEDKDKLYKARFIDKSIDGESYRLAKAEGTLPESLLKKA